MYNYSLLRILIFMFLLSLVVVSGCMPWWIGSELDDPNNIDTTRHEVSFLYEIEPDDNVSLVLGSGENVHGVFRGFKHPSKKALDDMLHSTTGSTSASTGIEMLQRGDTVEVMLSDNTSYHALFIGCHTTGVYLYHLSDRHHIHILMPLLDELRHKDGRSFEGSSLDKALRDGILSPVTSLIIETNGERRTFPMSDVQSVTATSRSYAWLIWGTLISAAIAVLLVVIMNGITPTFTM